MNIQVLVLSLFISCISFSQTIKIDGITGDTMISSGFKKIYSKPSINGTALESLKICVVREKSGYILGIWAQSTKSSPTLEFKWVKLKLSDGSVLEIQVSGTGEEDYSKNHTGWSASLVFYLNNEEVQRLLSSKVVFVRLVSATKWLDFEIKEKDQDTFKQCLSKVQN